jgi:hypothetical protein
VKYEFVILFFYKSRTSICLHAHIEVTSLNVGSTLLLIVELQSQDI